MQNGSDSRSAGARDTPRIMFTRGQSRTIAFALSLAAWLGAVFMVVLIGWLFVKFVSRYSSVLLPPVIGIVLAMMLKPLYDRLLRAYRRFPHPYVFALATIVVIVCVPIAAFLWLFGNLVVEQAISFIQRLPEYYHAAREWIIARVPQMQALLGDHVQTVVDSLNIDAWVSGAASKIGTTAYSVFAWLVGGIGALLGWFALPIYTALFLATRPLNGDDVRKLLVFAPKKTADEVGFLIDEFFRIISVFFRGQVLVALVQGILFGIGFQFTGLPFGLVIGLTLGLLNVIPYLGNILGFAVIVPLALFNPGGGVILLLKVVVVFTVVQFLDSYLITPKIIGKATGLNTLTIIFSLFFWNAVIGGAIGMVLAIPLSAFIVVFWRLLKREYFRKESV